MRCLSFSAGDNEKNVRLVWILFSQRLREGREIRAADRREEMEKWVMGMSLVIGILRLEDAQCYIWRVLHCFSISLRFLTVQFSLPPSGISPGRLWVCLYLCEHPGREPDLLLGLCDANRDTWMDTEAQRWQCYISLQVSAEIQGRSWNSKGEQNGEFGTNLPWISRNKEDSPWWALGYTHLILDWTY